MTDRQDARAGRSDALSALVVTSHILFTYAPVYLAAASKPGLVLLFFWLWFGLCKNGVINLMHECAHKLTFRNSDANDFLGGFILAPMLITDFAGYRERHWQHHRQLGTARDPKLVYHTNIRGWGLAKLALRSLIGVEAIRRLTERPPGSAAETGAKHAGISARLLIAHAIFIPSVLAVAFWAHEDTLASLLAGALAYGFVYVYGLGSLTVFAAALRAIAEHQVGQETSAMQGNAALRNLRCNPLTWLLLGAYGFGEHATHHSHPDVPYYRLPALTAELARTDPSFVPNRGYLGTIARLATTPQPATKPEASTT